MRKTTVYLPDGLKETLRKMAEASGRSEAELIRQAIAAFADAEGVSPRPRGSLFSSGGAGLAAQAEQELAGFGDR